jgi:hypothetical protein
LEDVNISDILYFNMGASQSSFDKNRDIITLNKGFVKQGCPNGEGCVGKYCEWNHDAIKDTITLNKGFAETKCPNGMGCVGEFCEWNHDATK